MCEGASKRSPDLKKNYTEPGLRPPVLKFHFLKLRNDEIYRDS